MGAAKVSSRRLFQPKAPRAFADPRGSSNVWLFARKPGAEATGPAARLTTGVSRLGGGKSLVASAVPAESSSSVRRPPSPRPMGRLTGSQERKRLDRQHG